jgi:hypothetical protein
LFEEDDHALRRSSVEVERLLIGFVLKCVGVGIAVEERKSLEKKSMGEQEKVNLMGRGGDLRRRESLQQREIY